MELVRAAEVTSFSSSDVEGGRTLAFAEGDVARFEDGDIHSFENTGGSELEYVSVTSPPLNLRAVYERPWPGPCSS